jgi:glycerol kinase
MQFLSDMLDLPVERPEVTETTALGAAYLAGLGTGVYASLDEIERGWRCAKRWTPSMPAERRDALYDGWRRSVRRVLGSPREEPANAARSDPRTAF